MPKSIKSHQAPAAGEIAACAYRIYEHEGHPDGRDTEHWLMAEGQLSADHKTVAGILSVKSETRMVTVKAATGRKPAFLGWPPPAHLRPSLHAN